MERNIQQALDDVGEIKRILNQTGRDLSAAVWLFFVAGIIWAAEGLLQLYQWLAIYPMLPGDAPLGVLATAVEVVANAVHWVGWLAVLAIWLGLRRRQKALSRGLALQLLDIWGCFLLGLPLFGRAASDISTYLTVSAPLQGVPVWYLFLMASLPLMLFLTGVLTGQQGPKWLAAGWTALSLALLFLPWLELPLSNGLTVTIPLNSSLSASLLPGLFLLALGALVRRQREGAHA